MDPFSPLVGGSPPARAFCGSRFLTFLGSPARSWLLTMTGATSGQLVSMLELSIDRPVVDKTGINGTISMRFTFVIDENTPAPAGAPPQFAIDSDPGVPTIFTALQEKLGLRLTATRAPIDVIVVDRAERPVN